VKPTPWFGDITTRAFISPPVIRYAHLGSSSLCHNAHACLRHARDTAKPWSLLIHAKGCFSPDLYISRPDTFEYSCVPYYTVLFPPSSPQTPSKHKKPSTLKTSSLQPRKLLEPTAIYRSPPSCSALSELPVTLR